MFIRFLKLEESSEDSLFLWGARQTGKSTLLKTLFSGARRFDLLKSEEFEHLIMQEIIAFLGYTYSDEKLTYWRTSGGYEVDCIIGNERVAIEFKSCEEVKSRHRIMNDVEIFPANDFL